MSQAIQLAIANRTVVFVDIDIDIERYQNLANGVVAEADALAIHPEMDKVEFANHILNRHQLGQVSLAASSISVHIISHGAPDPRYFLQQLTQAPLYVSIQRVRNSANGGRWTFEVMSPIVQSNPFHTNPFTNHIQTIYTGTLSVTPNNDVPVITVPETQIFDEDISLTITDVSVTDAVGNITPPQLSAMDRTLTVDLNDGVTISDGANDSTPFSLSSTEDIHAALAALSDQGDANVNGDDALTIVSTDRAGTPLLDTDRVAIALSTANDAPTGPIGTPTDTPEDNNNPPIPTISHLVLQNSDGGTRLWRMNSTDVIQNTWLKTAASGYKVVASDDFTNAQSADVLIHNPTTGGVRLWQTANGRVTSSLWVKGAALGWEVAATADLNGDTNTDIVLHNATTGQVRLWQMENALVTNNTSIRTAGAGWEVAAVKDFMGDDTPDILVYNPTTGKTRLWEMDGANVAVNRPVRTAGTDWDIVGVGQFDNGDTPDILLQHNATGEIRTWLMNDNMVMDNRLIRKSGMVDWNVVRISDYNNDLKDDILIQNGMTGQVRLLAMDGTTVIENHHRIYP